MEASEVIINKETFIQKPHMAKNVKRTQLSHEPICFWVAFFHYTLTLSVHYNISGTKAI